MKFLALVAVASAETWNGDTKEFSTWEGGPTFSMQTGVDDNGGNEMQYIVKIPANMWFGLHYDTSANAMNNGVAMGIFSATGSNGSA